MRSRSPFKNRMRAFSARMPPPPSDPAYEQVIAIMKHRAETDLEFRLQIRDLENRMPAFVLTRMQGGSGFSVAQTLRHFFQEYLNRLWHTGPHSLPTSFNVVESFLSYSKRFFAFDLREEREHLLRLHEYIDWYTAGCFPDKPAVLIDIVPEGVVYAYNMVSPLEDFAIETTDSKIRILGVALVRHGPELSAMIVAGEAPPYPSDEDIVGFDLRWRTPKGREQIRPHPSFGVKDRHMPELHGHARIILLARFDLEYARYDVRYVNLDLGASYMVLTDDRTIFDGEPDEEAMAKSAEGLKRYSGFFSALASMQYLPAFVVDQGSRVVESKFATNLSVEGTTRKVRNAIKVLGPSQVPFFRTIRCLAGSSPDTNEVARTIEPPDMAFQSSGYWRPLAPGEIGEAKDGTPIVGKTWVERTDSWSTMSLHSFVMSKGRRVILGEDPGLIYVMRSGSHYPDLYKIGLTRRVTKTRAIEVSAATGVPTPFGVLAQWEVGDCSRAEREIHTRLEHLRVNKRREFFRGNLQSIIEVIDQVSRDIESPDLAQH